MRLSRFRLLCLLPVLVLAACSREPESKRPAAPAPAAPAAANAVPPGWSDFTTAFIESRFKADPAFAVQSGRHEFDGQMPDWSRASIEAEVAALRAQQVELQKFAAATMTPAQRFERQYLEWIIDREIFWLATTEEPFRNPAWYLDRLDPSMYLTRDYAPLPKRLEGFLGYARAVPLLAAQIRANLRTPLPRAFIERGAAGFAGYATFFRTEMPGIFAQLPDERQKRD